MHRFSNAFAFFAFLTLPTFWGFFFSVHGLLTLLFVHFQRKRETMYLRRSKFIGYNIHLNILQASVSHYKSHTAKDAI